MTMIYNGNGEYTVHLSTGKEITLSAVELEEIANCAVKSDPESLIDNMGSLLEDSNGA